MTHPGLQPDYRDTSWHVCESARDQRKACDSAAGSAFGGKLGYVSPDWRGVRAGATFYTTQKLTDNDHTDLFVADGSSYSILGEVFVHADFGNTTVSAGLFEFDSPHLDTNEIRVVPNTFFGTWLANWDLSNTTVYVAHIDEWAGVGANAPEEFTDINSDDGVDIVGAMRDGIDDLVLQAWYYRAAEFADLLYLEAAYATDAFSVGAQFGSQSDDTADGSGPDGEVCGVAGSLTFSHLTLRYWTRTAWLSCRTTHPRQQVSA